MRTLLLALLTLQLFPRGCCGGTIDDKEQQSSKLEPLSEAAKTIPGTYILILREEGDFAAEHPDGVVTEILNAETEGAARVRYAYTTEAVRGGVAVTGVAHHTLQRLLQSDRVLSVTPVSKKSRFLCVVH